VIVDDYVAMGAHGKPAYANSTDANEAWLPILEKAVAKGWGKCWENLDGGFTSEALETLTGGVCLPNEQTHNLSRWDVDELYARLRGYLDRGDILSAGTHGSDERMAEGLVALGLSTDVVGEGTAGESVSSCGVVAGHAYSLLGVAEYEGTKLAQLRNPWGGGEWTGAWSDGAPEWTEEAKSALGYAFFDDGVFFMPIDAFAQLYSNVEGVRIFDASWSLCTAEGYFSRDLAEPRSFELSTEEPDTETVMVLSQPDWHVLCEIVDGSKLRWESYSRLSAEVEDDERTQRLLSDYTKDLFGHLHLGPSPCKVSFTDFGGEGHKFTLRVFSKTPTSVRRIPDAREPIEGSVPFDHPLSVVFSKYDHTGDGTIDQTELLKLLLELDLMPTLEPSASKAYLEEQIAKADTNQDGKVDFAEFIQYYNLCRNEELSIS